jgi:hypothetical protein
MVDFSQSRCISSFNGLLKWMICQIQCSGVVHKITQKTTGKTHFVVFTPAALQERERDPKTNEISQVCVFNYWQNGVQVHFSQPLFTLPLVQ